MELLELELKEAADREEKQRRLHETMMNCLKTDDTRISTVKESAAEKVA